MDSVRKRLDNSCNQTWEAHPRNSGDVSGRTSGSSHFSTACCSDSKSAMLASTLSALASLQAAAASVIPGKIGSVRGMVRVWVEGTARHLTSGFRQIFAAATAAATATAAAAAAAAAATAVVAGANAPSTTRPGTLQAGGEAPDRGQPKGHPEYDEQWAFPIPKPRGPAHRSQKKDPSPGDSNGAEPGATHNVTCTSGAIGGLEVHHAPQTEGRDRAWPELLSHRS